MEAKKVVLITGGSSGIGKAVATKYAKDDYLISISGRCQKELDEVLGKLIEVSPGKSAENFLAIKSDFADQSQVDQVVEETVKKFGRIDILINNAGNSGNKSRLEDADFFEDFQAILQVNLIAATRVAQLAIPHLIKTKGVIVSTSSIADRLALPSISYSVSKAGITTLTKCLANALEGTGVRVTCVNPGPIKTNFAKEVGSLGPLTCLNRAGEAEEVAELIVFLASDKASYIHGSSVDIDGGCLVKCGGIFNQLKQLDVL